MARDRPGRQRMDSDTLAVPCIFVPYGAPEPREWLARHPDAIKVPARLVRRRSPRAGPVSAPPPAPPPQARPRGSGFVAPIGPHRRPWEAPTDRPMQPMIAGTGPRAEDPVAVYLRMTAVIDRPRIAMPVGRDESSAVPAPHEYIRLTADTAPPSQPASTDVDATEAVPFLDDQGRQVLDIKKNPMLRPAGLDPHFWVEQGLRDRRILTELTRDPAAVAGMAAATYLALRLAQFRQGGAWDAQRVGGHYHPEFVDYATVAIGLYAAAAGISESDILIAENAYARIMSKFSYNTQFDRTYPALPRTNVWNTHVGYGLFQSGGVAVRAAP